VRPTNRLSRRSSARAHTPPSRTPLRGCGFLELQRLPSTRLTPKQSGGSHPPQRDQSRIVVDVPAPHVTAGARRGHVVAG
jgi:hypothetical protein